MFKLKFVLAIAVALVSCQSASASLMMIIDDLSTSGFDVVVLDEMAIGASSANGYYTSNALETSLGVADFMTWSGTIGGFQVVANTAASLTNPNGITLDIQAKSTTAVGGLGVYLIDLDFVDNGSPFLTNFDILPSGVGSAVGQSAVSDANLEFIGSFALLENEFLNPGDSFTGYAPNSVSGTFGMGLYAQITNHSAGTTQFSASLYQVPEPGSMAIWSMIGLVGLCARRRKS